MLTIIELQYPTIKSNFFSLVYGGRPIKLSHTLARALLLF